MTQRERKGSVFSSAIPNTRRVSVIVIACLLPAVFFFCNKNQTPVTSTPAAVKILSFAPTSAPIGDQIVITGENFSADKTADSVFFSHGRLALIDSATTAKLYVRVPQSTVTGTIVVRTSSSVDTSKQIFTPDTLPLPTITNLQPGSGPLGTIIIITGTNFDTTPGHTIVTMGGVREKIISISPTKIVVELVGGTTGPITINMNSDTLTTPASFTITKRNETITSFAPARGKVGTQVTITGTNFNPDTTGLVITFGSTPAQVVSVTATQIVTIVPAGAVTAPISVSFFGEQALSATVFQVEGKYQFDSVYVEIGNVPVSEQHIMDYYEDTSIQTINYSPCSSRFGSFNDTLSLKDTMVFLDSVQTDDLLNSITGTCITRTTITIDTVRKVLIKLIVNGTANSSHIYQPGRTSTSNANFMMQFSNIPFTNDSVMLTGNDIQSYFISGNNSSSESAPADQYYSSYQSIQFLPFTDSTYIKIILK
jgi:hypothetical protein